MKLSMDLAKAVVPYLICLGFVGLWERPLLLAGIYLAASIAYLWRWHDFRDKIYYFVPFFMGPVGEIIAIQLGAWQYTKPAFVIPLWLPLVWGLAGLFMGRTKAALEAMIEAREAAAAKA